MNIIESWQSFEGGEIQYFEGDVHETLRKQWDVYLANIEKDISELRYFRRSLQQKIEMFDSMRNSVGKIPHEAVAFADL